MNSRIPLKWGPLPIIPLYFIQAGIVGNTSRVLPKGFSLEINWNAWQWLPIFSIIQSAGNISDEEMRHVFNLGIGMIIICREQDADTVLSMTKNDEPVVMGRVVGV